MTSTLLQSSLVTIQTKQKYKILISFKNLLCNENFLPNVYNENSKQMRNAVRTAAEISKNLPRYENISTKLDRFTSKAFEKYCNALAYDNRFLWH